MNKLSTLIFIVALLCPLAAAQEVNSTPPVGSNFVGNPAASANSREEQLYKDATNSLNESQWQQAIESFTQVAAMKGRRADAALYWKAYALNKAGHKVKAESAIAELRRDFPRSDWLKDAGA